MLSSMLAGFIDSIFPNPMLQIPLLIVLVGLVIFYVQWKKKQM